MATLPAVRVKNFEARDDAPITYWRGEDGWYIWFQDDGVLGNFSKHDITEHGDGTVSVEPSIKITRYLKARTIVRHGYLRQGVWQPCGDDRSTEPRS